MLALVAALCFLLEFLNVDIFSGRSLIALGLTFLALHLVVPIGIPGRRG